jgi:hypothetical protein
MSDPVLTCTVVSGLASHNAPLQTKVKSEMPHAPTSTFRLHTRAEYITLYSVLKLQILKYYVRFILYKSNSVPHHRAIHACLWLPPQRHNECERCTKLQQLPLETLLQAIRHRRRIFNFHFCQKFSIISTPYVMSQSDRRETGGSILTPVGFYQRADGLLDRQS